MPFDGNSILIELDLKTLTYRLLQIKPKRVTFSSRKMKGFKIFRGEWVSKETNIQVCTIKKSLRILTQSEESMRQIWLVDMKVKL